ncbi:DUF2791 family P-loop domain-containing protein [Thermomicrobium sp. 4228-Ro]|uniref:BREX system ATP-binding domain-containing protein n=1 Tax=Thermomicrobium sp. 4228-Ro TaxID=2993937 RepID=UPI0022493C71|nr:BREX system ATP-binding domain-containing protein [Thermomicrobium sp. 4228-Ro]MCX2727447.1 DUF2791 family P-loop domain-containing protein [Thermomicrobium sp. 4228-Ro]
MLRGMKQMSRSALDEEIPTDRHACRRALIALKAGYPPRDALRYLSVGMTGVLAEIDNVLVQAGRGARVRPLVVSGDYGEGKSHTLRLIATEAERQHFAWVVVTHDRQQNIGLHKPAWLFQHILWQLRWSYPALDLRRWDSWLHGQPDYRTDRSMRRQLRGCLAELTQSLRSQGFRGFVLCLDELENVALLAGNQRAIFGEVLRHLLDGPESHVVLVLAATSGLSAAGRWGTLLRPPALDERSALILTYRIQRLHSAAFDWRPPIGPVPIFEKAWKASSAVPSGRWRTFVQSVVIHLEVLEQNGWLPTEHVSRPALRAESAPDVLSRITRFARLLGIR